MKIHQNHQSIQKLIKCEGKLVCFFFLLLLIISKIRNNILYIRISHSEIERRRREKMNRYIDEIAQLLPIDAVKKLDKLTVLRVAVDTIKHLKGR